MRKIPYSAFVVLLAVVGMGTLASCRSSASLDDSANSTSKKPTGGGADVQGVQELRPAVGGANCVIDIRPRPKRAPVLVTYIWLDNTKKHTLDVTPNSTDAGELIPVTLANAAGTPVTITFDSGANRNWYAAPWRCEFTWASTTRVNLTVYERKEAGLVRVGTGTLMPENSGGKTWSEPVVESEAVKYTVLSMSIGGQPLKFSLLEQ